MRSRWVPSISLLLAGAEGPGVLQQQNYIHDAPSKEWEIRISKMLPRSS